MANNGNLLVATADCLLQLDEIQLSGKKRMEAKAFLNGVRDIESCQRKSPRTTDGLSNNKGQTQSTGAVGER